MKCINLYASPPLSSLRNPTFLHSSLKKDLHVAHNSLSMLRLNTGFELLKLLSIGFLFIQRVEYFVESLQSILKSSQK